MKPEPILESYVIRALEDMGYEVSLSSSGDTAFIRKKDLSNSGLITRETVDDRIRKDYERAKSKAAKYIY